MTQTYPHLSFWRTARRLALLAVILTSAPTRPGLAQPGSESVLRQSRGVEDDSYTVLFLAADGPIWLKIRFVGQERGIQRVRTRYAAVILQSVDEDGNGTADASEASRLPASGRADSEGDTLSDRWMHFDTAPSDGQLSAEEYLSAIDISLGPRFLTSKKPPLLVQSVQLLSRLDRDHDRQISRQELTEGVAALTQYDFDNDGTFSPAELQPFPLSMVDAAIAAENGGADQPFLLVDESASQDGIVDRLSTVYGEQDGRVPRRRSGLSDVAFETIDRDSSGRLDATELAEMIGRPRPAAVISIDLAAGRVTLDRPRRGGPRVELLPTKSSRRVALRLGSEVVEFSARDNRYGASDQINLLRIRFLQGDDDKNGYMGPEEFASLTGLDASFDQIDADADGKVFLDELDRFVRLEAYLAQCAVEMEVESVAKPLFGILDTNLDRRLTSREFSEGHQQLQQYDQDGDGMLDTVELEALRRFRVRFGFVVPPAVQPERNSQMNANRRMPVTSRASASGPGWFQNMDRNQDGDVTWREFLGPKDAFDLLDSDGSGWIDAPEATAGRTN